MSDARKRLAALLWEKFGVWPNGPLAAWLTEADCARFADAILAAGWTPPRERTAGEDLALIRQTIREVKAETLREAASAAATDDEGVPWDDDHDRATVSAWLEGRAD